MGNENEDEQPSPTLEYLIEHMKDLSPLLKAYEEAQDMLLRGVYENVYKRVKAKVKIANETEGFHINIKHDEITLVPNCLNEAGDMTQILSDKNPIVSVNYDWNSVRGFFGEVKDLELKRDDTHQIYIALYDKGNKGEDKRFATCQEMLAPLPEEKVLNKGFISRLNEDYYFKSTNHYYVRYIDVKYKRDFKIKGAEVVMENDWLENIASELVGIAKELEITLRDGVQTRSLPLLDELR